MLLFAFGGPPLKGEETAWAEDEAAVCLQAHNGPMRSLLQSAASPTQGAMQFKTIQVLKTHGCVPRAHMYMRHTGLIFFLLI